MASPRSKVPQVLRLDQRALALGSLLSAQLNQKLNQEMAAGLYAVAADTTSVFTPGNTWVATAMTQL
jgi:hypothetical protein